MKPLQAQFVLAGHRQHVHLPYGLGVKQWLAEHSLAVYLCGLTFCFCTNQKEPETDKGLMIITARADPNRQMMCYRNTEKEFHSHGLLYSHTHIETNNLSIS